MAQEIIVKEVYFKQLKALSNVKISISPTLTAIMGVNGIGKTTVIHALACMFQPNEGQENYKFPYFFTPSSDSLWVNSDLTLFYETKVKNGSENIINKKRYSKKADRWSPRYNKRPKKDVYYIGIETCLPDIERTSRTSRIDFNKVVRDDKMSKKIIQKAAYILDKDYLDLTDNEYNKKNFVGVNTRSGISYSSLSMGTGEQRIIKILKTVFSAKQYSLILIDEVDLLLHSSALKKLIHVLEERSKEKNIQIIFTTHSLEIPKMRNSVLIQYIQKIKTLDGTVTHVYDALTDDLLIDLSGTSGKPIKIYVEDALSEAIAHYVCRKKGVVGKTEIVKIGSIENAFTIASGFVLQQKDCSNIVVLIDGDKYVSEDDKKNRIKTVLTGTELYAEEKRKKAREMIIQFDSQENLSPEMFVFKLIMDLSKDNYKNDIIKTAMQINAVDDPHEYINIIKERLSLSEKDIISNITPLLNGCEKWNRYIHPLEEWLEPRITV